MSDRPTRADNRRNHHTWQENAKALSGPVKHFSKEEIAQMQGKRINVTAEDQEKKVAEIESRTWDDQVEIIRKENARLLAQVVGAAAMPEDIEKRLAALAKLAEIAKKFINRPGPADIEPTVDLR